MYTPHLIFGENHSDAKTATILSALIEVLPKEYKLFFAEYSHDRHLESILQSFTPIEKDYNSLKKIFAEYDLDIQNKEDIKKCLNLIKTVYPEHKFNSFQEKAYFLTNAYNGYPGKINNLLRRVKTNENLTYQGIDIALEELNLPELSDERLIALRNHRDNHMAQEYINACSPAVGYVGLAHVGGIQKVILEKINIVEAKARFRFYYIISAADLITPYEKNVISKKIEFPLGLIILDPNKDKKIIIDTILKEIKPQPVHDKKQNISSYLSNISFFDNEEKQNEVKLRELASNGNFKELKALLGSPTFSKKSINAKDSQSGKSALHLACEIDHYSIITTLIQNGSNIFDKDRRNKIPLDYCTPSMIEKILPMIDEIESRFLEEAKKNSRYLEWKKEFNEAWENFKTDDLEESLKSQNFL